MYTYVVQKNEQQKRKNRNVQDVIYFYRLFIILEGTVVRKFSSSFYSSTSYISLCYTIHKSLFFKRCEQKYFRWKISLMLKRVTFKLYSNANG